MPTNVHQCLLILTNLQIIPSNASNLYTAFSGLFLGFINSFEAYIFLTYKFLEIWYKGKFWGLFYLLRFINYEIQYFENFQNSKFDMAHWNAKIDSVWNRILWFLNVNESEVKIEKLKMADSKCKKLIYNGSSSPIIFPL